MNEKNARIYLSKLQLALEVIYGKVVDDFVDRHIEIIRNNSGVPWSNYIADYHIKNLELQITIG